MHDLFVNLEPEGRKLPKVTYCSVSGLDLGLCSYALFSVERKSLLVLAYLYCSMVMDQLLDAIVDEREAHPRQNQGEYHHDYYDMLVLCCAFSILQRKTRH